MRSLLANPDQPWGETLSLLDALADGQAARREIERDDALGRTAFGDHWRGTKSSSAPLGAIVEWMRSLKGLGAAPRIAAARRPDQQLVGEQSASVREQTGQVGETMRKLWAGLTDRRGLAFVNVGTAERADLEALLAAAVRFDQADQATRNVMSAVPSDLGDRLFRLDRLRQGQEAAAKIAEAAALGHAAFGAVWAYNLFRLGRACHRLQLAAGE